MAEEKATELAKHLAHAGSDRIAENTSHRQSTPDTGPAVKNYFAPPLRGKSELGVFALAHYLSQTEWWSEERLVETQLRQATELVRFARQTLPFYQDRLTSVADSETESLTQDAFAAIPILTRDMLQDAAGALFSAALPPGHGPTFDVHTSGSSGRPVHVRSTALADLSNRAVALRGHQWFRRDLTGSNVTIKVTSGDQERTRTRTWATGSSGPAFIYNNKVPVDRLHEWLLRDGPHYLQCHPSILKELIHRSIDVELNPARLRDVRTMGEILEPGLRDLCQSEWGVPVRDNYSSEEFGTIALTCPDHDHLHVQSERVIVEILDDEDRPCAPGTIGRVVVTGLLNFATPLIRHELGDRAVAGAPCPCGRGLPVIERIIGRERNPVTLPSGDRVFPVLDAEPLLLKYGVRQYQLVQKSVDQIDLILVSERQMNEPEAADVISHLQRNFGHPFHINLVYVDHIPRDPSGKFQIFKSDLSKAAD